VFAQCEIRNDPKEQPQVSLKIIIGNDHGGYTAKLELVRHLEKRGFDVTDIGSDSEEIVRYPLYAKKVACAVATGAYDRGILLCCTGIGMAIAAGKVKGIRPAVCTSTYVAKMTRRHNDSNVLCLGGKTTGIFELIDIVDAWLDNDFEGGRHSISLGLIEKLEDECHLQIPAANDLDVNGDAATSSSIEQSTTTRLQAR
jgi:ribose 5-phosphate isomerase B